MRLLKSQSKTLLNMKMVFEYLNFIFHIEVKAKSNYKILNFTFQFIKIRNGTLGTWIKLNSCIEKNFRIRVFL